MNVEVSLSQSMIKREKVETDGENAVNNNQTQWKRFRYRSLGHMKKKVDIMIESTKGISRAV